MWSEQLTKEGLFCSRPQHSSPFIQNSSRSSRYIFSALETPVTTHKGWFPLETSLSVPSPQNVFVSPFTPEGQLCWVQESQPRDSFFLCMDGQPPQCHRLSPESLAKGVVWSPPTGSGWRKLKRSTSQVMLLIQYYSDSVTLKMVQSENYSPSLSWIYMKNSLIFAKRTQQYTKIMTQYDHGGLVQGYKAGSVFKNELLRSTILTGKSHASINRCGEIA